LQHLRHSDERHNREQLDGRGTITYSFVLGGGQVIAAGYPNGEVYAQYSGRVLLRPGGRGNRNTPDYSAMCEANVVQLLLPRIPHPAVLPS
jgi:hypothetical protein